jgi:hypothetical protein
MLRRKIKVDHDRVCQIYQVVRGLGEESREVGDRELAAAIFEAVPTATFAEIRDALQTWRYFQPGHGYSPKEDSRGDRR